MLRRLGSGVALIATAAMVLAGCTPPEPVETTPASTTPGEPTATPATEDELLAAARSSWDRYQQRLSSIGAEPSTASLNALLEVAERPHAEFLLQNFQRAAEARVHNEGARSTTAFSAIDTASAPSTVLVGVCVDVSNERVVGDEGEDLTLPDRDVTQSLAAEFIASAEDLNYLVANVENYAGSPEMDPCQ